MSVLKKVIKDKKKKGGATKDACYSKVKARSKTPVLDNFGRDLTSFAIKGKLDPVIGREKEIERVSQILSRRKKIIHYLLVNRVLESLQ